MATQSSSSCEERAQVERLLADPLFSQSKRYGAFLRYVTHRALSDTHEHVTERALGVEIFGRPPNYDTEADPIVRVTASELRKRLSHYYEDPAHAGEIRLLIHKGSYTAEFVAPGAAPPSGEAAALQSPSTAPTQAAEPAANSRRHLERGWRYVAAVAGIGVVAATLSWAVFSRSSAFDLFWAPVLDGSRDVLLSFPQFSDHVKLEGIENPQLTWTDPLTPVPDRMDVSWALYAGRLVHLSDLSVACRLSEFLGSRKKHALIKGEHDLTMRDLRESPAVILGGLNNQWTGQLLPQARYTFDGEGRARFIRDRQKPDSREWKFDANVRSGERERDFIIISRVSDSASGRVAVLAGGFSAWGTEAAVNLITDPTQMQAVLGHAPRKWAARNLQIVLECSVVRRESGIPRFLAVHYW